MKLRLLAVLLLLLLGAAPAQAGSLLSDEPRDDHRDDHSAAHDGDTPHSGLPALGSVSAGPFPAPPTTAAAAAMLHISEDLLLSSQAACELTFARRYRDARAAFDDISARYPTSGVGPLGNAILYQALMFENFDWAYDAQFRAASAQTRAQVELGLEQPGAEPLEQFVLAGLGGLDAIHSLRKGDYLVALGRALVAMRALRSVEELAPAFPDPRIGDGMYLYWRSVVTAQSSLLPDFPDRRREGIEALQRAEAGGVLLGPGASLVLAFAWIEERDLPRALRSVDVNNVKYPDCVVNALTRGRILTSMRRYDEALAQYDRVVAQRVNNERVHYFRGIVLARTGRYAEAAAAWTTYLGFSAPPEEYRAQTYYRLGDVRARLGDSDGARAAYAAGAKLGNVAAKHALEAL